MAGFVAGSPSEGVQQSVTNGVFRGGEVPWGSIWLRTQIGFGWEGAQPVVTGGKRGRKNAVELFCGIRRWSGRHVVGWVMRMEVTPLGGSHAGLVRRTVVTVPGSGLRSSSRHLARAASRFFRLPFAFGCPARFQPFSRPTACGKTFFRPGGPIRGSCGLWGACFPRVPNGFCSSTAPG